MMHEEVPSQPGDVKPHGAGAGKILIVEDDPVVLTYLKIITERAGYRTLTADNGMKALELLRSEGEISLIISDVVMPGGGGNLLQAEVAATGTPVKILFISGYPIEVVAARGIAVDQVEFLQKPVQAAMLLGKVNDLLA